MMKEQQSMAMELLQDLKKQNKRLFIIWVITFVALVGVVGYTIYLLNDYAVVETTKNTQEIEDVNTIHNSTIKNGD